MELSLDVKQVPVCNYLKFYDTAVTKNLSSVQH